MDHCWTKCGVLWLYLGGPQIRIYIRSPLHGDAMGRNTMEVQSDVKFEIVL